MLSDDEIDPTIKVWIPFIKFLSGYSLAPRPNSIVDSKEIINPSQPELDIHWNHVQWSLSPEMRDKYTALLSEFSDVFAWEYANLKVYDKNTIQHKIPVKLDQKPFRQKLRRINP